MLSRDHPLHVPESALLVIDMQNFSAHRDGGAYKGVPDTEFDARFGWFFKTLEQGVIPNIRRLQAACRRSGVEVLYTTIESLTKNGRDRGLDYKRLGFDVPKGSWDGRVIDQLAPEDDEIVLPKSSSSVFISTHIDYVLRNLGIRQLVICGMETDDCVESAIRDAADLGYLVTQVTDACATYSAERHEAALAAIAGHCRQVTTDALLAEMDAAVGTWA
ncbi:isochorismatase family cysteine hydrolase [Tropicimonas isoalkanivorans]|uniref:Ureidoacrylate peracid hydrolase n=1 Tax=Tropicimonas isoalkanivorans TaxID=441112 RepID=A0A1I1LNQ9_9RHOB|nr:isochorismatase family cysteine hydrolase [Tropicimonas isoalkanivorans]SFC71943.1 ureidoacrylate peracid hydrolase [Tropicimonas isoalkanivorans]